MKMQKYCNFTIFDWDASWSTECRLTQREIFTTFRLDLVTLRRCNVVTLFNIYINKGKIIKTEQHLLGQQSQNTITNS